MTEIRFYHLLRKPLERALPELLEKCLQRGWRAVVMAGSEQRVEDLSRHLWTYSDQSFLPHGSAADGNPQRQPVWITDSDENPNASTVLFLTDGASSTRAAEYDLVCEVFDGNDPDAVTAARSHWRAYTADGHVLAYWQQDDSGRWVEKQRIDPGGDRSDTAEPEGGA